MTDSSLLSYDYIRNANREVVLYLHGFLGCKEDWSETAASLGESFSHLQIDLTGHGVSAETAYEDRHFTMAGCAAKVIEVLDHLKIERCRLVAYSMGGRLGLFLLTHYPDRFLSAVIESASPGLKTKSERDERRARDERLAEELAGGDMPVFLERWYAQPLFATLDRAGPGFEQLFRRRRTGNPEQLARSLRLMGTGVQPSLWDRLGDIACPVLFVAGERDDKFRRLAEEMHRLCPKGQKAIIPKAGHSSHFERPEEFARAVRRFFAEHA